MAEATFNEIRWTMEMLAEFWGDSDGSFFDFESISKNRRMQYPMLPDRLASKLNNSKKVRIPNKQAGEKRILSADIALLGTQYSLAHPEHSISLPQHPDMGLENKGIYRRRGISCGSVIIQPQCQHCKARPATTLGLCTSHDGDRQALR